MVVGRGVRAAHARRRPTQYGYTYCTRGTVAVTNQHAARTRPAVSGIGERRVCSTCSRLLVEPRRDPASMCTQVLATGSSARFRPFRLGGQAFATRVVAARPYAARNCEGWRVAGAGRVVKRARRAGKGWAAPAPAESQRSEQLRGVSTSPRPARLGEGRDPSSQAGGGADHFIGKRTTETLYRSSALVIRYSYEFKHGLCSIRGLADVRLEPKAAV